MSPRHRHPHARLQPLASGPVLLMVSKKGDRGRCSVDLDVSMAECRHFNLAQQKEGSKEEGPHTTNGHGGCDQVFIQVKGVHKRQIQ